MLEIKNSIINMRKAFDKFISRLDMAEEKKKNYVSDMSVETSKTEKRKKKY